LNQWTLGPVESMLPLDCQGRLSFSVTYFPTHCFYLDQSFLIGCFPFSFVLKIFLEFHLHLFLEFPHIVLLCYVIIL
jgi:hypothetical protein